MTMPDELRELRFPEGWGSWSILSGKELELPRTWIAALAGFMGIDEDASFYPLEVKDEQQGKRVLAEAQMFHSLNDKELGLLDGIRVQVPVRIVLQFDAQGKLTDASKEPPMDRDLKAAGRLVLNLLDQGEVDLPDKKSGPPKPWRIVQDEDGIFRLERAYFA